VRGSAGEVVKFRGSEEVVSVAAVEGGFGAEQAGKFVADVFGAAERSGYPMASGPRGIVADVQLMATFEVGDPVEGFVGVKPHDFTRDSR